MSEVKLFCSCFAGVAGHQAPGQESRERLAAPISTIMQVRLSVDPDFKASPAQNQSSGDQATPDVASLHTAIAACEAAEAPSKTLRALAPLEA